MISLNSLLETVTRSAEEYHRLNKDIGKKETVDFSTEKASKKDVVIINPTLPDGQGDYELARKLQKLISSKGLQVVTRSLAKINIYHYESILGKQEKLKSDFIIIAPFGFCLPETLTKAFEDNVIINEKTKVVMINEIEADSYAFNCYKRCFEKIDVKHVYEEKLGFGKNGIGYIPLEKSECTAIEKRAKNELENLLDSFNLHIDSSAHYYVSYLNSDIKAEVSQLFILKTLHELRENPSAINYIFSLGQGNWKSDVEKISTWARDVVYLLRDQNEDIANKFSKLNLLILDVYKNKIFNKELENWKTEGGIPINVIFMNSKHMPKNIWHDFIAISKSGMMTGDQSFCDYLSIKKEMPFYEMRNWKWPLRQSLIDNAEKMGGKELKEYVRARIIGRIPPNGHITHDLYADISSCINDSMLNDQLKNDFKKFGEFLSQRIANGAIKAHLNKN
ncbi:MAG: hypothetical protein ACRDAI_03740 [Candidatus Rhabdochlamydia sp.]